MVILMIDKNKYKGFIVSLSNNTSLKQLVRRLRPGTNNYNFFTTIRDINISEITGYNSTYTIYDLLFGDLSTIHLIDNEFRSKSKTITRYLIFEKQFERIRNQNKVVNKKLIDSINVISCPYCETQIIYDFEAKNKKMSTAHLDHFIPKSQNEMLAMSLSNLVPSCEVCNSRLKGTTRFRGISTLEDINKPEYYELWMLDKSMADFYTHGKIGVGDFKVKVINNMSLNHLQVLELENRVNSFKKHLRNYINLLRTTSRYKKQILADTFGYEKLNLGLYNQIALDDELSGVLNVVKEMMFNSIKNDNIKWVEEL